MIHLTLPYPISSNRYWAVRVIPRKPKPLAITYVTEEAKNYKAAVGLLAKAAGIRAPSTGRVVLHIKLFPHRPQDWAKRARKDPHTWDDTVQCIDLGNCEKVLSDALNGIAWVDDKQIRRTLLERMEPDEKGARLEVAIEYLAAAPSLFGEAAA
ncbi:RusA family crossover junction endodeoxyribonuclease [Stenotrophomonas maltophilia]|uniref:RusA family crossover junction endodeoxyribonuclease n=1 Tax=Stenotrophomonas maltophilia TaxID=40324 RepID=A0AAI9C1S7_STEMA|nr:RusA family crossover junction endodeoxyribonuclease [Stenotrophomonas maltophilia]